MAGAECDPLMPRGWGCPSLSASPRLLGGKKKQTNKTQPTTEKSRGFRCGVKPARCCHHSCLNGTVRKGRDRHCLGSVNSCPRGAGSGAAAPSPHPRFSSDHNKPRFVGFINGQTGPAAKMCTLERLPGIFMGLFSFFFLPRQPNVRDETC